MAISVGVIISLVLAIILLFISMVLSAMSASAVSDKKYDNAHKYATASAVVCGLSVLVLVIAMIVYIRHESILSSVNARLTAHLSALAGPQAAAAVVAQASE